MPSLLRRLSLCLPLLIACDDTDRPAAEARVLAQVEARCADPTCHGVTAADRPGFSLDPARWLTFDVDSKGHLTDRAAALESMRAKVSAHEDVEHSTLLRKLLPVTQGGLHHYRGAIHQTREDAGYQVFAEWAASVEGTEGHDEPPLSPLEQLFADTVYPVLIQRGCATATCHGPLNFGVTAFRTPVLPGTLSTTRADLRATYTDARRNVTLWGEPLRSRLISKMLPLDKGGIPHKGGNDVFFAAQVEQGQDPREADEIRAIQAWIAAERKSALGTQVGPPGEASAIVFVGGPLAPAGPFEVPGFHPGTDLYRLDAPFAGATPVNLTAAHHAGPADIRDPAVSHDGKRLVFSMRTSAEDAHNLYTLNLDGTDLRPLTNDRAASAEGRVIGHFGPVFGPPGGVGSKPRIHFSSTAAADPSDDARFQNADLYAIDPEGGTPERLTYTVVPEVEPSFLQSGEFAGTMVYTIQRAAPGGYKGVLFRFPVDHNPKHHFQPEAHPHFGMSEPPRVFWRLRELPDGRATLVLLDEANVWRGGQLAVLERQFAVEVPEGDEDTATLPGFRHALAILTPEAAREGPSQAGFWRDPSPMPDGSLLAARAQGAVDLSDREANPHTELVRVFLAEDRGAQRPVTDRIEVLFERADLSVSQPVAVYPRPLEDEDHERAWEDSDAPATLVHSGVQVIEAVLAQLPPVAPRQVREDLVYVRAVVPLSVAGPLPVEHIPAAELRDTHPNATNLGLSGHMPLFAAVEAPVAPDGSLAAKIPSRVPVRVVTLDAEHMAAGAQQPQWYAALPGERFPVGIPLSSFAARCAGCHGAMDGQPTSVLQPPTDMVTQASVTEALYEGADRRKPLELPTIGAESFVFVDFRRDVAPILEARCAGCHRGEAAPGGLTLTAEATTHFTDAYESLLRPGEGSAGGYAYVDAAGHLARASYLTEKILGRELSAQRELTQPCPPEGPPLSDDERLTLLRWIELGATYVGAPE